MGSLCRVAAYLNKQIELTLKDLRPFKVSSFEPLAFLHNTLKNKFKLT